MVYVIIAYLWLSLYLYLILGGADFGVGVMELFSKKKNKNTVKETAYKSIGPIWEANHMWLIIAIVILFVGFSQIYTTLSIYLHIPLVLLLLGIIARGTAFTFRHYDAVNDDWQKVYTTIFTSSSLLTPFFLGIIAASTVSGTIDPSAKDFLSAYIWSWWNLFGISVGIFTVCISAYLASIYIIGETEDKAKVNYFVKNAIKYMVVLLVSGFLVFAAAYIDDVPLLEWIFGKSAGQIVILMATISVVILIYALRKRNVLMMRMCAAFQVLMILVAATYRHYPDVVLLKDGSVLSLLDHAGTEKTVNALAWALLLGSIFILPFLGYLLYSFHQKNKVKDNIN